MEERLTFEIILEFFDEWKTLEDMQTSPKLLRRAEVESLDFFSPYFILFDQFPRRGPGFLKKHLLSRLCLTLQG